MSHLREEIFANDGSILNFRPVMKRFDLANICIFRKHESQVARLSRNALCQSNVCNIPLLRGGIIASRGM